MAKRVVTNSDYKDYTAVNILNAIFGPQMVKSDKRNGSRANEFRSILEDSQKKERK